MINRNASLHWRYSVRDQKPRGRWRSSACPTREGPESGDNQDRRRLGPIRQGGREAPCRSSEPPKRLSHLESKPVIQNMRLQHVEKATTDDPANTSSESFNDKLPDSSGGSQGFPAFRTQAGKRADVVFLRKHLERARHLASAIKRGQSYFHLLLKEEQEEQEVEERRRMRREEQLREEPRPPSFFSDSDSESEVWPVPAATSCSSGKEARWRSKKKRSARPFTPLYYSLTSPLLSEAPREVIYRQLCCLNWLLEALTLDRPGRIGPLTACWDSKDPGRGRTVLKTLKKERAADSKWEQFVSNKPCRAHPKRRSSTTVYLQAFRRASFMSVASLSALTSTTVGSSLSSLVPGPGEDTSSAGAPEETQRPPSEYVQQRVQKEQQSPQTSSLGDGLRASESKKTDNQTESKIATASQPKSCPTVPPSAVSHLIHGKASVLQELRAAFKEKAEEVAESYVNTLELKARERLNSGLQMYRALCHKTESQHHAPHHVTCKSQVMQAPNNKNNPSNNLWLSSLLSSLPEELCEGRAVNKVMQKLSGFAEQQTIRVRPQVFLKVLGGLEPWELCLPELCVAVQLD
ncbi:hypothetical protein Q8A73_011493 [Channa argus]|nr:hypothetical protein Q8A73_011493 [Channa argus]